MIGSRSVASALAFSLFSAAVSAGTRPSVLVNPNVNGNGTAKTIQQGIDMVDPGGKVMVLPGTYAERLVIDKGLTLEAIARDSGPVVLAPPAGSVIAINVSGSDAVTIRGIDIQHSGLHGIAGTGVVNLTVEECSIVGELGTTGRAVVVLNESGTQAHLVVRNTSIDLLQHPSTPDGAPHFQNFGITPVGNVDSLIKKNVVRRTGGACIFIQTGNAISGPTNADVVGNDLDECYPAGRAGSLLVGPGAGLQPSQPVTATGTVNIVGNLIRNSTRSCRVSAGINYEMFTGKIEDNIVVDVVPSCAAPSLRNLQAGIWIGSLKSFRGSVGLPPATPVVSFNNISGNAFAGLRVSPDQSVTVDAPCNWWGAPDGPSGNGPGSGDAAIGAVSFVPWATAPIAGATERACSGG